MSPDIRDAIDFGFMVCIAMVAAGLIYLLWNRGNHD